MTEIKSPSLDSRAVSSGSCVAHRCRIALTGGPGGGKTTAIDLFRREMGEGVVVVPEAATLMFTGGFPRYDQPEAVRSAQLAIYHVQRNLEDIQAARYPDRILLCDRGTIDGAAYWPEMDGDFFETLGRGDQHQAGEGLGLAIAKGMIGAHGGKLMILDTLSGESGTCMRIELPLVQNT